MGKRKCNRGGTDRARIYLSSNGKLSNPAGGSDITYGSNTTCVVGDTVGVALDSSVLEDYEFDFEDGDDCVDADGNCIDTTHGSYCESTQQCLDYVEIKIESRLHPF